MQVYFFQRSFSLHYYRRHREENNCKNFKWNWGTVWINKWCWTKRGCHPDIRRAGKSSGERNHCYIRKNKEMEVSMRRMAGIPFSRSCEKQAIPTLHLNLPRWAKELHRDGGGRDDGLTSFPSVKSKREHIPANMTLKNLHLTNSLGSI